jgi:hypothetical protein
MEQQFFCIVTDYEKVLQFLILLGSIFNKPFYKQKGILEG